jgi:NAD(P)-dependent dehydrogenase (short-subunit alcohol dehydrogenase family)
MTVALVTGGGSGIGLAIVRQLAAQDVRVAVADVDLAAARRAADETGGTAVPCDVRDPDASEAAVAEAERAYGALDLVFLNAGVSQQTTSWDDLDVEAYRRTVAINVDGVVFGVRAALPALRRQGTGSTGGTGSTRGIVVTASLAGLAPAPATPVYALTKAAVVAFVRSMAPGLQVEGITLNAVCPGFVDTPLLDGITDRFAEAGFPLMSAEQVARAAVDLAQGEQTGQCVVLQPGREPTPYAFRGVPGPRGVGEGARPPTRYPLPPGIS